MTFTDFLTVQLFAYQGQPRIYFQVRKALYQIICNELNSISSYEQQHAKIFLREQNNFLVYIFFFMLRINLNPLSTNPIKLNLLSTPQFVDNLQSQSAICKQQAHHRQKSIIQELILAVTKHKRNL